MQCDQYISNVPVFIKGFWPFNIFPLHSSVPAGVNHFPTGNPAAIIYARAISVQRHLVAFSIDCYDSYILLLAAFVIPSLIRVSALKTSNSQFL